MRPLLPTLKEKKRYVVYELITERPLAGSPEAEIINHLKATLGLFDAAKAGILPVKYDGKSQSGVLRVSHTSVDKVKASLLLLKTIGGTQVIPRVRGVSGILGKTKRFIPARRTTVS
jgi:RNase P/RNase MRP subunit POP5